MKLYVSSVEIKDVGKLSKDEGSRARMKHSILYDSRKNCRKDIYRISSRSGGRMDFSSFRFKEMTEVLIKRDADIDAADDGDVITLKKACLRHAAEVGEEGSEHSDEEIHISVILTS